MRKKKLCLDDFKSVKQYSSQGHGLTHTVLYETWRALKRRPCTSFFFYFDAKVRAQLCANLAFELER
jgi:hypothetical protein